jgi:hypothetical protein
MDHKVDTAFYPSKARVKNQINKADKGRGRDAALASIHALLRVGHCLIFTNRRCRVRSAVFFPIAVVDMVIIMMPRLHILRNARDDYWPKKELRFPP